MDTDGVPSAPLVTVLLLGPVDVRRGAESVPLAGAKVRAVLAQLALAGGHVVSADSLIDGVWGEDAPATAANTLQYHVGMLRKALASAGMPDAVATRPPGYSLAVATDLAAFRAHRQVGERAAAAGSLAEAAEAYAAALSCWRGPALSDLLNHPFAASRAVAIEEERLRCVEAWVDAELGRGAGADLVAALQDLVRDHPTRERFWEQLMVALYRGGRQADALAAFARARELLDEELGLEPSPALRQMQTRVLAHDQGLLAPVRGRPQHRAAVAAGVTQLRSSLPSSVGWIVQPDGQRFQLGPHAVVIGRAEDCALVLVGDKVSRRHAQIVSTGDGHALEDLKSTNGTSINGTRIAVLTRLFHGDRIELGDDILRYENTSI